MIAIKIINEEDKHKIENDIRILLVTSAEIEKNRINQELKPLDDEEEICKYNKGIYEFFIGKFGNYNVVHLQTNIGSSGDGSSIIAITNALQLWKIKMVVMIGIAFGKGKEYRQKIGDVIISKSVFMYEGQRIKEDTNGKIKYTFLKNPYANAGRTLIKKFSDDGNWNFKLNNGKESKVHLGTILTGEKLVDSKTEKNKLLELANTTHVVGGEMEATGLVTSCLDSKIDEWIVVKGISDWGDGTKQENKEQNQNDAINAATSYCKYIFNKEKIFDELLKNCEIDLMQQVYGTPLMTKNMGIELKEDYEISLVPINNVGQKIIRREKVINDIINNLENQKHLNIYGEVFCGKTTLLKILSSQIETPIKYINLYEKKEEQISTILLAIYDIILKIENTDNIIIAIDNIPKISRSSKIHDIFEILLSEAKKKNIRIIFTSLISQESVYEDISEDIVYLDANKITKQDVIELLKIYNAPENMYKDKIVEFILYTGKEKIFIVVQIIKFLQKEEWKFFENGFIGIIKGEYVLKIKGEIQEILLDRINTKDQKDLLYRIGCINSDLKIDEIKKISEVEPKIENPLELLEQINGTFIEFDIEKNIYKINPLINQISRENTDSKIYININKVMAEKILEKKHLEPYEIMKCIGFFVEAHEYDNAGELYLEAINSMFEKNIKDEWGLKSIWKDLELPDKMDSQLKLKIRVAQLRYYIKFGIDYKKTLDLTFKLVLKEKYDDAMITGISLILVYVDPIEANKFLKLAFSAEKKNTDILEEIRNSKKLDSKILENFGIETLLWATLPHDGNIEIFESWVDVFTTLGKEEYGRFKKIPNEIFKFEDMYIYYIDKTWVELNNNVSEDIEKIKKLININLKLVEFAKKVQDDYILAISIRNIVIFKCEYLKDQSGFDFGIMEFQSLDSEKSKFIVSYRIGEQYFYINKYDNAKLWLEKALNFEKFCEFIEDKIWILLELSEIYQEIDKEKSYYYAQRVIEFIDQLGEKNKIRFYLEYLIRCFYLNKFTENIESYFNCTELMLDNISEKGLVAMFVHIIGYITAYVLNGIELDKDNNEYRKPYTRMTIYSENMNSDLYADKKVQAIYFHTFKLLSFLRNKEKTLKYSKIIYDYVFKDKPGVLILFPIESIVFFIENFMFKEALNILKIYDIFKKNKEKILLKNSKENPLEFIDEINNIYQMDNSINLKDMSEFFIFNIIFFMIEENKELRINQIKELQEFQKLPEKMKEEYINIMEFIQNKSIIPMDYLKGMIVKNNKEKDITFEIIYRILLINQLSKKELINNQINIIIFFISSYECFCTEKTLLVLFIRQIREIVENNNEYRNKDKILQEIENFNNDTNVQNAKKIYIEMLVDIGFEDIIEDNLNWLKEK